MVSPPSDVDVDDDDDDDDSRWKLRSSKFIHFCWYAPGTALSMWRMKIVHKDE
jgi:hypothetical protein